MHGQMFCHTYYKGRKAQQLESISAMKKIKVKDACIDYSSNVVKELLLLGGGGSTLCCQISNPLTMPVWQV